MVAIQKPINEALAKLSGCIGKDNGGLENKEVMVKVVYYGGGSKSKRVTDEITSSITTNLSRVKDASQVHIEELHIKEPQGIVAKGTALAAKYCWVRDIVVQE